MTTQPQVYVVGRYRSGDSDETVWDLQGVFTDQPDAVAACRDATYFVGPVKLNEILPHETTDWPGCFYPKAGVA